MARSSLYYFNKYILGFRDMALQPHWELCQFIEKYAGVDDCLILLPRGTFKSSIITIGYPLWSWLKDRDLRFLISSAELNNSKNFLGLIRDHIERNDRFRSLFGKWDAERSKDTWNESALCLSGRSRLAAEASATASSVDVTKVSQHYDKAILDDLQTDKNVASKELIDKIESYLQLLLPILDPQRYEGHDLAQAKPGPRIIVGTRWHFDDVYGRMIAYEQRRRRDGQPPALRMYIKKAFEQGGKKVFFPSRFTVEYLDNLRKASNMTPYQFSCQYLNDPMPDEESIFKLSRLGWFYADKDGRGKRQMAGVTSDLPPILYKFTTIDPSMGETDRSDYTAIITVAVDSEWNIYIWEVLRDRLKPEEILLQMFDVHKRMNPFRMGMESVAFQRMLIWGFERMAETRGDWFYVEPLKTDNTVSKQLRIRGFEPFVTGRKVFLRVRENNDLTQHFTEMYQSLESGQDALVDEMSRFPLGTSDDCLDALAYTPQLIFPAGQPPPEPVHPRSFRALVERFKNRSHSQKLTLTP